MSNNRINITRDYVYKPDGSPLLVSSSPLCIA